MVVINLHLEAVASIKLNYLHFKLEWLLWLLITFPGVWSSRELLTNTPSTVLKQVLNEDAFESPQIPLNRAWLLVFCYPAEKCQAFPYWINIYYLNAPSSACCKQSGVQHWTMEIRSLEGLVLGWAEQSCSVGQQINPVLWKLLFSSWAN